MNKVVEDAVLEAHNELMNDLGIDRVSKPDAKMSRGNGIDSLGIVTLILNIEEKLDIDLEPYLKEVRNSYYVKDLIDTVEKAYLQQKTNT